MNTFPFTLSNSYKRINTHFKKTIDDKDRLFFCCAQQDLCNYFECVLKESFTNSPDHSRSKMKKNNAQALSTMSTLFWKTEHIS